MLMFSAWKKFTSVVTASALIVLTAQVLHARTSIEAPEALSAEADYRDLVTRRQTVDLLIAEALQAFKSPARISHAGYTGKLTTNMEIVADRLLLAAELEPYRADLLFSAASAHIVNGDIEGALELYRRILTLAPEDADAHTYLAAWQRFLKNSEESSKHMGMLDRYHPRRARDLEDVFLIIDQAAQRPVIDTIPIELKNVDDNTAIVTLGYALNPDGSMHDTLYQRLDKTLEIAREFPDALIVVTGGVPQNNKTEARLMAQWLVENGVNPDRIVEDNAARSTVENALFTRYALARHDICNCVIISSGSHVRRAEALFDIACRETGPENIRFIPVAAPDKPLAELQTASESDLRGIYRDALKTMGLWSFRSYPLEER